MALNPFSKSPDYSFASSAFGFELSKKNIAALQREFQGRKPLVMTRLTTNLERLWDGEWRFGGLAHFG
jgi:hypothetical protein